MPTCVLGCGLGGGGDEGFSPLENEDIGDDGSGDGDGDGDGDAGDGDSSGDGGGSTGDGDGDGDGDICMDDGGAPVCDPLTAATCGGDEVCVPLTGDDASITGFGCETSAATATGGQACEDGACGEGFACVDASRYGSGCTAERCCTELCDLCDLEFACADPDQTCVPLFEPDHPDYPTVGVCRAVESRGASRAQKPS